jgi:hypothetical protein
LVKALGRSVYTAVGRWNYPIRVRCIIVSAEGLYRDADHRPANGAQQQQQVCACYGEVLSGGHMLQYRQQSFGSIDAARQRLSPKDDGS